MKIAISSKIRLHINYWISLEVAEVGMFVCINNYNIQERIKVLFKVILDLATHFSENIGTNDLIINEVFKSGFLRKLNGKYYYLHLEDSVFFLFF